MDQERHTLTVVKDHKGKSLIKESCDSDGHSLRYGPSCLWLGIKLTELSVVNTVSRKKGKEIRVLDEKGEEKTLFGRLVK